MLTGRLTYHDRAKAEKTIHPIRWEWFQELRPSRASHNGEPYVFEFRNFGMFLKVYESLVNPC